MLFRDRNRDLDILLFLCTKGVFTCKPYKWEESLGVSAVPLWVGPCKGGLSLPWLDTFCQELRAPPSMVSVFPVSEIPSPTHVFRTLYVVRPDDSARVNWLGTGYANRALVLIAALIHSAERCGAMRMEMSWLMLLLRLVCGSIGA